MRLICAMVLITLWMPSSSTAQTQGQPQPATPYSDELESQGWMGYAQVQGSSSSLGTVVTEVADVGYDLTPHFGGSVGVPFFHVRSPFSIVANKDWRWTTLLGDPWVDVHYVSSGHGIHLVSVLTGTIPVSNSQRVFTTGRFGVDWFNHLEHAYARLTPFLNLGASNGTVNRYLLPRPYSEARPYQTLGFMSDFEAGGSYQIHRGYRLGVSGYALLPGGPQKVYSRFVSPDSTIAGDGNHLRYFDSALETMGTSRIDRDSGFSGWLDVTGGRYGGLQIGYTWSAHYRLDIITVVLNLRGSSLLRVTK